MHDLGRHRGALDHHGACRARSGIIDSRAGRGAAPAPTFLQISDSHVGFDKPANPNALGTLEEAINKIKAMPAKPSFMIHTGDITPSLEVAEFDNADRIISQGKLDVHYVPGEHDFLDEEVKLYRSATAAAPGAPAGIRSMPAACTSLASSTSSTSRPAASAISAPSSSPARGRSAGPLEIDADRACSRTSRCGQFIRNGAGAPRTAPARWTTSKVSVR